MSGQPNSEAHGAYAFCALGCLAVLDDPRRIIPKYVPGSLKAIPSETRFQEGKGVLHLCIHLPCFPTAPADDPPRYLDLPRLISWLSSRQYAPEGGFSGRTNKLVDGCYSHWVGGCFPLIETCLRPLDDSTTPAHRLPPAPESLFSREGLIRYILCCCQDQSRRGGLRDKPGKYVPPLPAFLPLLCCCRTAPPPRIRSRARATRQPT